MTLRGNRRIHEFALIGIGVDGGLICDSIAKSGIGSVRLADVVLVVLFMAFAYWSDPFEDDR